MRFFSLCVCAIVFTGCSSLPTQTTDKRSPKYQVSVWPAGAQRTVATQEQSKTVVVKKCDAIKESCESEQQRLEYSKFSENLHKKIKIRSIISHQISLLEQQAASLRLDRDVLKQEVEEFDRSLRSQRFSSLKDVTNNIERLRMTVSLEIQELEQKLSLTEKDLQVLKENAKQPNVAQSLLEHPENFGQSLLYKDNLIAQTIDEVIAEMI